MRMTEHISISRDSSDHDRRRVDGRARTAVGRTTIRVWRLLLRTRNKTFSLMIGGAFAEFGAHSVVELPLRLKGERAIAVGSGVFIGANSWLQVIDGNDQPTPSIRIGDGTSFAGGCVVSAARRITIGRNVLIARNVYIADHRHAFDDGAVPVLAQGLADVRPVEIGDNAWLGQNVVICPGVRIGAGAVVGANSVVREDVPARSIAVGTPARVVRDLDAAGVAS